MAPGIKGLNAYHNVIFFFKNCYKIKQKIHEKKKKKTLKITKTKLYVSIVTLSTGDSVKLTKQLNEGFENLKALKICLLE